MKKKTKRELAVGAAATALVAGTLAYVLSGKRGAKNRKKLSQWTAKAKGEMLQGLRRLRRVDAESYMKVVDAVGRRYVRLTSAEKAEIKALASDFKKHWKVIGKRVAKKRRARKSAPKRRTLKRSRRS